MLCVHCNQAIGLAKDDPERFELLAAYLDVRQNLPSRKAPGKRRKFDWVGDGGEIPGAKKERQLHAYRFRIYGITMVEFHRLVEDQSNRCAACDQPESAVEHTSGKTRSLAVDHDHETGAVRGLLCWRCNAIIGRMDDAPDRLRAAAFYLESSLGLVARVFVGHGAKPLMPGKL